MEQPGWIKTENGLWLPTQYLEQVTPVDEEIEVSLSVSLPRPASLCFSDSPRPSLPLCLSPSALPLCLFRNLSALCLSVSLGLQVTFTKRGPLGLVLLPNSSPVLLAQVTPATAAAFPSLVPGIVLMTVQGRSIEGQRCADVRDTQPSTSLCLSAYLSASPPLCVSVSLDVYLTVSVCLSVCVSVCLSVCLSVCPYACLSAGCAAAEELGETAHPHLSAVCHCRGAWLATGTEHRIGERRRCCCWWPRHTGHRPCLWASRRRAARRRPRSRALAGRQVALDPVPLNSSYSSEKSVCVCVCVCVDGTAAQEATPAVRTTARLGAWEIAITIPHVVSMTYYQVRQPCSLRPQPLIQS